MDDRFLIMPSSFLLSDSPVCWQNFLSHCDEVAASPGTGVLCGDADRKLIEKLLSEENAKAPDWFWNYTEHNRQLAYIEFNTPEDKLMFVLKWS